jgi:hypothetical protein
LLTSGYSAGHRPGHDPSLPMLHKPYTRVQLAAHLRAALDAQPEDQRPETGRPRPAATRTVRRIGASG